MSLKKLISQLDNTLKTKILGEETTLILKYTFCENDTDAISTDIIDEAVALKDGISLVNNNKQRGLLIDSIRSQELKRLGFKDHEEAKKIYSKDIDRFFTEFNIEEAYREIVVFDERENQEYSIPKYGENNGINAFLHPYQFRLKKKILNDYHNNYHRRLLVTMPTGAGKTILAVEALVDLFRSNHRDKPLQIIWAVDRNELCEQSLQSFQKVWKQKGDYPVLAQRYWNKFDNLNNDNIAKITFASFKLMSPRLKKDDPEVLELFSKADLLVIDEAHGSEANTYKKVILIYDNINEKANILGLTATPYRAGDSEFKSLKDLFHTYLEITDEQNGKVNSPMTYLIKREYLSRITYETLNAQKGNNSKSEYYGLLHENVKQKCEELIENSSNTIIFAESKSHAIAIHLYLLQNSIENEIIIGETHPQKRKDYLSRFGDNKDPLSVIVNHQILSTGIDVPGMNSIMILAEINSPTLALQILGRAMRGPLNGGNKSNTIYLTMDNKNKLESYNMLEKIVLNN